MQQMVINGLGLITQRRVRHDVIKALLIKVAAANESSGQLDDTSI